MKKEWWLTFGTMLGIGAAILYLSHLGVELKAVMTAYYLYFMAVGVVVAAYYLDRRGTIMKENELTSPNRELL